MRKQIIAVVAGDVPISEADWLPLAELAQVEVTSEDADHPIEAALLPSTNRGWRAAVPGAHLVRLRFDAPQRVQRIRLRFVETEMTRTQEFVVRVARNYEHTLQDIVRQQWNFSPDGATSEIEEYQVDLAEVTTLELAIVPSISDENVYASLAEFRLA